MSQERLAPSGEGAVRKQIILSLLLVTPLGFLCKLCAGPAQNWVNNYVAGVLYEIFWCLALLFLWPHRTRAARIAVGVFVATSLLEALQLWHPWLLEQIRATFVGRTLLGTTFSWWDFPHYLLGCALSWLWMLKVLGPEASGQAQVDR